MFRGIETFGRTTGEINRGARESWRKRRIVAHGTSRTSNRQ